MAVFSFPKWLLGARGNGIGRRTATKSASGTESVVRLGTPFLAALARTVDREPVSEREAEGLSDMLVGMLWAPTAPATATSVRRRADALLERMRRYALEHLRDPGLGPDQIARAHFVSTRYVHKLFAAAGCGVAAWVREQRLERGPSSAGRARPRSPPSQRGGDRDPASFSRAFRQTYGCSPRELRRGFLTRTPSGSTGPASTTAYYG